MVVIVSCLLSSMSSHGLWSTDLILAQMQQLDQRNLYRAQAVANLWNSHKANGPYFDQTKCLCPDSQRL
jgi:hypothetical protein